MDNALDLNGIAIFVRIVETGSLTRAARLLNIPKTTVSKRLADLEATLGVALLTRTTRSLSLTEIGKSYFSQAQDALRRLDQAGEELGSARAFPSGQLKVTAPVDVSHAILPRAAEAFSRRYPTVTLELLVTNRVVDLTAEGVDLAIRAGMLRDSRLVGRQFMEVTSNLYASADYLSRQPKPLSPKSLSGTDFIGFSGRPRVSLVKGRATVKVSTNPRIVVDDLHTARAIIELGYGIGWLPDFIARAGATRLVPAIPGWRAHSSEGLYFVYPNPKHPSINVKAFVAVALEILPVALNGILRG